MMDPTRFLEDLTGRYARPYREALMDLLVAMALRRETGTERARKRLGAVIMETMGVGEVLGATLALQAAATTISDGGAMFQTASGEILWTLADRSRLLTFKDTPVQTILPRVTLTEAVQDMVERTPVTIRAAAERTAQQISRLYSEGRVVAFAKSAEQAVTERVQALITEAIREGVSEGDAGREIKLSVNEVRKSTAAWTEGYARMAFRTNVNTAVTAGRFRQVRDPDIKAVIPCLRQDDAGDGDVRRNHRTPRGGIILRADNSLWHRMASPLGYSCRCRVGFVTLPMLRRLNRIRPDGSIRESVIPAGYGPDDGFRHGGRPDLFVEAVLA